MLAIRLRRMGSKKRPFFRIVVTDSRAPRDSRAVEILGNYDPRTKPEGFTIDHEKYRGWVSQGARPSNPVRTLVDRHPPVEAQGAEAPAVEAAATGAATEDATA
jgi:small subunit ribosomal protein S16